MCEHLTLAVSIQVQHTARPHHRLQWYDLIERHSEQLVVIEATGRRVVCFMGTEIVMTKGKPFTSTERERESRSHLRYMLLLINDFVKKQAWTTKLLSTTT